MKREILNLMHRTRAFEPFRLANRRKALVLHYHRFSPAPKLGATAARVLEEQLAYLTRRYEVVPLSLIVQCLSRKAQLPRRTVAITVDDGYQDFYDIAFPLLERFKVPATIFVVADFVDRKCWIWTDRIRYLLRNAAGRGRPIDLSEVVDLELLSAGRLEALYPDRSALAAPNAPASDTIVSARDEMMITTAADQINSALKSLPESQRDYVIKTIAAKLKVALPDEPPDEYAALSWDDLRHVAASGVEVGSHSMTHPILTLESNERVRYEVSESKSKIERLSGWGASLFCYPNGDYERRGVLEARRARYIGAVTCQAGLNSAAQNPYEVRRVHTVDDFPSFLQGTSGLEEMKQAMRRRGLRFPRDLDQRYGTAE